MLQYCSELQVAIEKSFTAYCRTRDYLACWLNMALRKPGFNETQIEAENQMLIRRNDSAHNRQVQYGTLPTRGLGPELPSSSSGLWKTFEPALSATWYDSRAFCHSRAYCSVLHLLQRGSYYQRPPISFEQSSAIDPATFDALACETPSSCLSAVLWNYLHHVAWIQIHFSCPTRITCKWRKGNTGRVEWCYRWTAPDRQCRLHASYRAHLSVERTSCLYTWEATSTSTLNSRRSVISGNEPISFTNICLCTQQLAALVRNSSASLSSLIRPWTSQGNHFSRPTPRVWTIPSGKWDTSGKEPHTRINQSTTSLMCSTS